MAGIGNMQFAGDYDKSSFNGVVKAEVLVRVGSSKELYANVHSSFIHNTYNLETIQVFTDRGIDNKGAEFHLYEVLNQAKQIETRLVFA